jgi:regulatory protein
LAPRAALLLFAMGATSRQPLSLRARALRWLANREHSQLELRTKLLRAAGDAHSPAEIDALLEQLVAQGHLSNERFVESRLHARSARFGNRRIQQELRQHGVTLEGESQAQLLATELARAREVWRKKFGVPAHDTASRARQARFLAARGFSAETVHRIVSGDHEIESI